ncbi:hypothetical protein N7471_012755 [Penicillium samsonianum]|uniref:uncharacterized protein n=1 Tax=Penicillium samsonianum TaxID=1882272 RepID=UPI002546B6ED|nr:uncharacterized protein N7471_012755 [Penicillium samsonianum]KAJ6125438.1 hypothetical protein N7471_012755 [Penicillium samsonianum]
MNMIDLIYVKYSPKYHFRPPSVQAESCCDHPSTRISYSGATISSPLKSRSPAILDKPNKPPLET